MREMVIILNETTSVIKHTDGNKKGTVESE